MFESKPIEKQEKGEIKVQEIDEKQEKKSPSDDLKAKLFDQQKLLLVKQFETYSSDYKTHPIFKALNDKTHLNFDTEEREKILSLNFYNDYITSDEENDFEEKELIEEGEIVDPMQLQQLEESEEEDVAELKQDEGQQ